ncbi:amino acid adenylation domain-containing protein [Collinsella ihumii]|uniref:amino acid adenylation domain-containing protein n=1 Tax=Collinsella ihumii TaxID=1720204 RepID=UPI00082EBE03|nr:amino acid adenylation domain-containing protein [Collinsella ihumii]
MYEVLVKSAPAAVEAGASAYRHTALVFLERGAARHPGRVAVVDERSSHTYGQLFSRARRAGSGLIAGGYAGVPVVLFMEKSSLMLAAMFGVLAAGGCYVPVDMAAPVERSRAVLKASGARAVIAAASDREAARERFPEADVLAAEELVECPVDVAGLARTARGIVDSDAAYVLFTSGSTGTPKGVVVSHRAIVDFVGTFVETFGLRPDDILGNQAPFDFDVSVKDIYGSLAAGARLVILPRRLFSAPSELMDALRAHRVTVMVWAVAALCLLSALRGLERADLPRVRFVMFSGEVMPPHHLRLWMERLPQARFVNLYGPTEVTCNCLFHEVDRERAYGDGMPLGEPFSNRRVLVLDGAGHEVRGSGEMGELYVGGSALASGYAGDDERTARAFVRNPLQPLVRETLYRTGDLVRLGDGGELFFCGRADNQIKHLGHRIELEEVDAAFERQPGVLRCRCAYDARRQRICAFVEGADIDVRALRHAVARVLPGPFVPAAVVPVETMPLTKNGKVDRAELLRLHADRRAVSPN